MTTQAREQLYRSGKNAAYKNQCKSVAVALDHTGKDNYHNCQRRPGHSGWHTANVYRWFGDGADIAPEVV